VGLHAGGLSEHVAMRATGHTTRAVFARRNMLNGRDLVDVVHTLDQVRCYILQRGHAKTPPRALSGREGERVFFSGVSGGAVRI
jgi:hypothetical protein